MFNLSLISLSFYIAQYLSEEIRSYLPYPVPFSNQVFGILSSIFMLIGLIMLLKKKRISILAIALSAACYFIGGIAPMWPEYGVSSFSIIMKTFYVSVASRMLMVVAASYLLRNENGA
jgi:uncharacterized membrane protein